MALLSCAKVRIAFDGPPLLDDVSLSIEKGERVGFLGRNGEGKSTFLKILSRDLQPDAGEVVVESGARLARVDQQVPEGLVGSTLDVIRQGVQDGTSATHPAERLASILSIDPAQDFTSLSGGQQRRALLARALVGEPEVLLLDEPTNHLDLAHIEQLESILLRHNGAVLFITHDRAFLQRVATRIVELDRGRLTSWDCDYHTYLQRKEELLAAEEREWNQFDKELAKEEAWLRRGIKARRTRNEGRVRALQQLRRDRNDRRERVGQAQFEVQEGGRTSAKIVDAKNVSFGYEPGPGDPEGTGKAVLRDLSTTIFRGDKVGIIGPNGSGKTTLLKLMIGELEPQSGTIKHGTRLQVAYFDQHRDELDPNATLAHAVGGGSDYVQIGDERRHIYGYLEDFLFSSETTRRPVWSLSGGERNRLLLAKLFTKPANVLVLDEPTNDLDMDTLELLEARLVAFQGTVLVVSHDRAFLDNLCTSTLVFEGDGTFKEYVGGYSDWQRVVGRRAEQPPPAPVSKPKPRPTPTKPPPSRPKKLSYREKEEWEALPGQIESLEAELKALQSRLIDPDFLRGDPAEIRDASVRLGELTEAIERAFDRWAALDERT